MHGTLSAGIVQVQTQCTSSANHINHNNRSIHWLGIMNYIEMSSHWIRIQKNVYHATLALWVCFFFLLALMRPNHHPSQQILVNNAFYRHFVTGQFFDRAIKTPLLCYATDFLRRLDFCLYFPLYFHLIVRLCFQFRFQFHFHWFNCAFNFNRHLIHVNCDLSRHWIICLNLESFSSKFSEASMRLFGRMKA